MPFVNQRKSKVRLKRAEMNIIREQHNNGENQQTKNCLSGEMKKLTNI